MKSADGRFEYLDLGYDPLPAGTPADQVHRFGFRCPRRGDMCSGLNLRDRGHDITNKSWTWDGNIDQPTLKPSINCSGCGWHGWIEQGRLRDA